MDGVNHPEFAVGAAMCRMMTTMNGRRERKTMRTRHLCGVLLPNSVLSNHVPSIARVDASATEDEELQTSQSMSSSLILGPKVRSNYSHTWSPKVRRVKVGQGSST